MSALAPTPLTVDEIRLADTNFEESSIKAVERIKDGFAITRADGWSCFLTDERNTRAFTPVVGDLLRVYGTIGQTIYGMDLNGDNTWYLLPKEREAERAMQSARYDRERRERYVRERDANNAAIAALPEPLRKRMERFRMDLPEEDRLDEGYEIYACTEAAAIADICRREKPQLDARAAVEWFRELPYAEQVALGMNDGHSGNTFGGACQLAYRIMAGLEV